MPATDEDAPSLRRERSWRCGLSDVNVGAICVGTPVPEVLRKVFEGFGAAPLDPDVSMFSATVMLMRSVAAGALPHGPLYTQIPTVNSSWLPFFPSFFNLGV